MGKDGQPYCEKDYQKSFGVKCAYCERYISGKVLQAGDNHHFHPTCARCSKCGDPFGDGEEMYLQGTAIWHPRCGPGPSENGTTIINGTSGDIDRISNSAMSEIQVSDSWRLFRHLRLFYLDLFIVLTFFISTLRCIWSFPFFMISLLFLVHTVFFTFTHS